MGVIYEGIKSHTGITGSSIKLGGAAASKFFTRHSLDLSLVRVGLFLMLDVAIFANVL